MPRIHAKHAHVLFAFFMSCFMGFMMSGIVTLINQGLSTQYLMQWMHAFVRVWPIAFVLIFLLRPLVTRIVSNLVMQPQG